MNEHIDDLCDDFESAVKSGKRPEIGQLLDKVPDSSRAYLLRELVSLELEYRARDGETCSEENYTLRFPKYGSLIADIFREFQATSAGSKEKTILYEEPVTRATSEAAGKPPEVIHYFGDYELLEKIAQGGMGVVYKARQVSLNRVVAIKMILGGQLASEDAVQRFHAEAEAAARLDHPNIVPIYEVGKREDQHYFSMGYIEGESLATRLIDGPLESRKAVELLMLVVEAITYAHSKGVIHRDLKPANILLDDSDQPRITDFGLAKQVESNSDLTASGQVLGTPSYMPPEQAEGKVTRIGPLSDVYALGAVLYELLTGRPPFQAATTVGVLMQVMEREPISIRELDDSIPKDLETICHRCLQKNPQSRYATAAELGAELERFLAGEPILARPVSTTERAWRWSKRNPLAASLSVAVFAVLLLGTIISTRLAIVANRNAKLARAETVRADDAAAEAIRNASEEKKARLLAVQQLRRTEEAQHANQIASALRAWNENDLIETEKILADVKPQYQDVWETLHLKNIFRRKLMSFQGHTEVVRDACLSIDGQHLISGGDDRIVRIWDTETGEEIMMLRGHKGTITSVDVGREGNRVVSGSKDQTVKVWDTETGKNIFTLKGHTDEITGVDLSGDGKLLVSGSKDGTVKTWDLETGQELLTLSGHKRGVTSVSISGDGKRIASGSQDKTVKIWDASTGQVKHNLRGHWSNVINVTLSADGTRLVSSGQSEAIKVWDADNGQLTRTIDGHKEGVYCASISDDGNKIVSAGNYSEIKVWDADTGQQEALLYCHTRGVANVRFGSEGKRIVSAGFDKTVRIWNPETEQARLSFPAHTEGVSTANFSSDGKRIISGGYDSTFNVWDTETGRKVHALGGHHQWVTNASFSNDDKQIISAGMDKIVRIRDAETEKDILVLPGAGMVYNFSDDGKWIVSGNFLDKKIKVWDTQTGQQIRYFRSRQARVWSVDFSSDGKRVLSGGLDKTVTVWNVETGEAIHALKGHTDQVFSVCFSSDGKRIVSGSMDKTVKVWDAETGEEIYTLTGHTDHVHRVCFSPDDKRILSASFDQTARVWDVETGQQKLVLHGHKDRVLNARFSLDGKRIVTGSDDGVIKVWNAELN